MWASGRSRMKLSPNATSPNNARSAVQLVLDGICGFLLSWLTAGRKPTAGPLHSTVQDRLIVPIGSVLFILFGSASAAVLFHFGALYVAPWPGGLAGLCCLALVHRQLTQQDACARLTACYGVCLAGIGMYWALGGNLMSIGIINWAFVGPQFDMVSNGSIRSAVGAHVLTMGVIVVLTVLEVSLGPGSYTPQVC